MEQPGHDGGMAQPGAVRSVETNSVRDCRRTGHKKGTQAESAPQHRHNRREGSGRRVTR